ncbi:hypothetical protein [Streptomyces sp. NPDC090132]|uniref:hypothetical protein n=1 Tax=Streptomyces sp. NPDC090132 TaxID=3365955 RepID=UPI0038007B0D
MTPGTPATVKSRSITPFDDDVVVNCRERMGVAFQERLVSSAPGDTYVNRRL